MMIYRVLLLFFFIPLSLSATFTQEAKEIPCYPGELMSYDLRMGLITLGKAEISFASDSIDCGAFIYVSAKSVGFAKFIKDIEYTFNACMDQNTGLPKTSTRIIREAEYTNNNIVYYYHNLRPDSSIVYSNTIDSLVVPKDIFDILTGFYHFRTNYLNPGTGNFGTVIIKTFFIDAIWDLTIRYAGKETIETKYGKKECLKIMPVTQVGKFFDSTDDMTIWVTNDKQMIPVKIYVDLKVGSLTADLVKYKAPRFKTRKIKRHH
jgi:hypothetical protein